MLKYKQIGDRWEWWHSEDVQDGEAQSNIYYTTNDNGNGVFVVNSERNTRNQIAGICDFSVYGLKDPKRKIRKFMDV